MTRAAPRRDRRGGRGGLVRLLLLLLGLALPGEALAHAALLETQPADGATLARPPETLLLRFDEPVTLLGLRMTGPAGEAVALSVEAAGDTLRARLPAGPAAPGTYLVTWRVISADGHPVAGTIAFGIGTAPERAARPDVAADPAWNRAAILLRFLLHAGFVIGAGGALYRALVAEVAPGLRRGMALAALAGAAAVLAGLGVQGGAMLASAFPEGLAEAAPWRAALHATPGWRAAVTAPGLVLVAAALAGRGRAARLVGVCGAVLAAAGLSLSGHAAHGGWPVQLLLALHALAAAYWLGAFLPLLAALRGSGQAALEQVRSFARIAVPSVALLLLSGAVQAALHLGSVAALTASPYGRLVLAKVAGAGGLLLLAAVNRLVLTPGLARGTPAPLARSIRAEMALGAAVLGVTAILGMTPPRASAQHDHDEAPPGILTATQVNGMDVLLEAMPGRAGTNRLTLLLERPGGGPAEAQEVWLDLSQGEAGVTGLRRQMRREAPGRFVQEGPELAVPGRWTVGLEILVGDFDLVTATTVLELGP